MQPYTVANCLTARMHKGINSTLDEGQTPVVAFHPTQDPISSTDICHSISSGNGQGCATAAVVQPIAWANDLNASIDQMGTLIKGGAGGRHEGVAVAVALRGREGGATAELGDEVQNCLRASQGGGDKPHVLAPVVTRDIAQTITSNYGKQCDNSDTALGPNAAIQHMAVRRLTPVECERLQGFPDDYTAIPWRKKPASECPDGPRYKALGNSMAVPVMAWIGRRIAAELEASNDR
jgi:DNA (cytosine-5)-methyltransferase 1